VASKESINWISKGVFVGASREPHASVPIAYLSAYVMLIQITSDIQDDETRTSILKAEFVPKLHHYLVSKDAIVPSTAKALAFALGDLGKRHLGDFEAIWLAECQFFALSMPDTPPRSSEDQSFTLVCQRWTDLTLLLLSQLSATAEMNVLVRSAALTVIVNPIERTIRVLSTMKGKWVEGTTFLANLLENELFANSLVNERELRPIKRAFRKFLSKQNIIVHLQSPSVAPFIRVIVGFIAAHAQQRPDVKREVDGWSSSDAWATLVDEAIPKDRPFDIRSPESLIAGIISIPQDTWAALDKQVSGTDRMNQNLVDEFGTAMQTTNGEEKKHLQDILIALIERRGIVPARLIYFRIFDI
jgi:hypothetical protein